MRTRDSWFAVLLLAASVAVVLTPSAAEAQEQKGKPAAPNARDAAIQACIARAQASDPLPTPEAGQRRLGVYKACMREARQRP
jgi:hypothetical protein